MEYIIDILTAVGAFLGGGWIVSIYKAKPEKTSIELENMGKAMDEMNKVIDAVKDNAKTYKEYTDSSIRELKTEVSNLNKKVEMKNKAIYSAYECPFPKKATDCIVLKTFHKCDECLNNNEQEATDETK